MKRVVMLAALGGFFATAALAQPAVPPRNAPANPAVKDPQANVSARPISGANSFTQGQAKAAIEARGFTQVAGLVLDAQGVWRGTASRDGRSTPVALDYQGNVHQSTQQ